MCNRSGASRFVKCVDAMFETYLGARLEYMRDVGNENLEVIVAVSFVFLHTPFSIYN